MHNLDMLPQISIVSIGAKADTLWRDESYWVQTEDHRYVCLRKLCVNSPHTMKEDTVFFELTNMFSFSTKEHKELLSVRRAIVKQFVLH